MATVIADTSPLQYLFQVGLIDLLRELFETVHVPLAVRDELQVGRSLGFDVPDPADRESCRWPASSVRSATGGAPRRPRGDLVAVSGLRGRLFR